MKDKFLNSILFLFIGFGIMLFFFACTKQDHYFKDYIVKRDYTGRVDSAWAMTGNHRIKISYLVPNDYSTSQMIIFWNDGQDSTLTSINHNEDTGSVIIENLDEGDYIFNLITENDEGVRSLPFEITSSAYGDNYKTQLTDKKIDHTVLLTDSIIVYWESIDKKNYLNTEFIYTDKNGEEKSYTAQADDIRTVFKNVDWTKPASTQSKYKDSTLLDSFYSLKTDYNLEEKEIHHLDLTENGTFADMKFIDFYNVMVYGNPDDLPEPKAETIDLLYIRGASSAVNIISPDQSRPSIWDANGYANTLGSFTIRNLNWMFSMDQNTSQDLAVSASNFEALDEHDRSSFIDAYKDAKYLTGFNNGLVYRTNLVEGDVIWFRIDARGLYVALKVTHIGDTGREFGFDFKVSRPGA